MMHDDLVNLSLPDEAKKTIEGRAFESGSGVTVIVESLWDQRPSVSDLGLGIQTTCIVLDLARREIIG
jgi:hypothetical protein